MLDRRQLIAGATVSAAALATASCGKEMQFYHDFSALGLSVPQLPGAFAINQQYKEPLIVGYMLYALGKLRAKGERQISVGELFCADAYYSFIARRFGAERCDAFDNDQDGYLEQARTIAAMLKEKNVHIHKTDVFAISPDYRASIVINAGGLYHVSEPLKSLEQSYEMSKDYLVVQSVVTLANEDPDYFETPAPGWTWGCRFSYAYLQREIKKRGYRVIDTDRNILVANGRPEDRGSAYFLISRS